MGSFTNQPDFATRAQVVIPSNELTPANFLNKAAIYICGSPNPGTGRLKVVMPNQNGDLEEIIFRGLSSGMFLPVCVDYVLASDTNVEEIIAYW